MRSSASPGDARCEHSRCTVPCVARMSSLERPVVAVRRGCARTAARPRSPVHSHPPRSACAASRTIGTRRPSCSTLIDVDCQTCQTAISPGPTPSGRRARRGIDLHLRGCADCRSFALALEGIRAPVEPRGRRRRLEPPRRRGRAASTGPGRRGRCAPPPIGVAVGELLLAARPAGHVAEHEVHLDGHLGAFQVASTAYHRGRNPAREARAMVPSTATLGPRWSSQPSRTSKTVTLTRSARRSTCSRSPGSCSCGRSRRGEAGRRTKHKRPRHGLVPDGESRELPDSSPPRARRVGDAGSPEGQHAPHHRRRRRAARREGCELV